MSVRRTFAVLSAAALMGTAAVAGASAASADDHSDDLGNRSLAMVLAKDAKAKPRFFAIACPLTHACLILDLVTVNS